MQTCALSASISIGITHNETRADLISPAPATVSACCKSLIKSFASSIPTERRTRSRGGAKRSFNTSGILACDIRYGRLTVEPTEPKLTAMVNLVTGMILKSRVKNPLDLAGQFQKLSYFAGRIVLPLDSQSQSLERPQ